MSTQESTPRGRRGRTVLTILAAVVFVVVVVLVLVLAGAFGSAFAREIDRTVRTDVDASGLVASLVSYPDSFRGGWLSGGRVELGVEIDQTAVHGGALTEVPPVVVLRTYSCPGADGRPATTRLVLDGADAEHVRTRPAVVGGGVALEGVFEIVRVEPVRPGPAPECRIDLAAR